MKALAVVGALVTSLGISLFPTSVTFASSRTSTGVLHGDTYVKVPSLTTTTFEKQGPYPVGESTLNLPVTDHLGSHYVTTVEVWYPAVAVPGSRSSYNLASWVPSSLTGLLSSARAQALVAKAGYLENAQWSIPVASGQFPLVVFSHGYAGIRDQSSYLTTRLASWGFVVAAPEHVTRDFTATVNAVIKAPPISNDPNADVAELLATVSLLSSSAAGQLSGHVDVQRVVAFGHSAGATAVEELAAYESSLGGSGTFLKGWIALGGASLGLSTTAPYDAVPTIPGVIVAASRDHVAPLFYMKAAYGALTSARRFIELRSAGHQIFSDTCAINGGHGAAVAIAAALGGPLSATNAALSSDGCFTSSGSRVNVAAQWAVVEQVVVASTRVFLGIDTTTRALSGLANSAPSVVALDTTGSL